MTKEKILTNFGGRDNLNITKYFDSIVRNQMDVLQRWATDSLNLSTQRDLLGMIEQRSESQGCIISINELDMPPESETPP